VIKGKKDHEQSVITLKVVLR